MACWASFVAEEPREGPCRASFFAEMSLEGWCWASFFAPAGAVSRTCRRCGALRYGCDGGFALHEAFLRRVAGVSNPRVVQFPPIGDGEAASRGGVAAKVQTHWAKITENGLFWLNESTFWRIRRLSWCVVRARTRYVARKPDMWSVVGLPRLGLAG